MSWKTMFLIIRLKWFKYYSQKEPFRNDTYDRNSVMRDKVRSFIDDGGRFFQYYYWRDALFF